MASPTPSHSSSPPTSVTDSDTHDNPAHLNFDNTDALELLLQTITQNLDSPHNTTPASDDWTQMSAWANPSDAAKPIAADTDFTFFPLDLDFDHNMAVDPSALHFNTSMFTQPSPLPEHQHSHPYIMGHDDDPMSAASIFALSQPWPQPSHSHLQPGTGRRLSITSSSSSSGASLSPILEPHSALSNSPSSASSDCGDYGLTQPQPESDPAYELAQRVRQSAGVTLAVPVSSQVQQLVAAANVHAQNLQNQPQPPQASPVLAHGQKLAIPRMPARPSPPPAANSVMAARSPALSTPVDSPASSPPPSLSSSSTASPTPNPSSPSSTSEPAVVIGVSGRPKTSHTTIERRYRTNLNARITGLKHAVPALRVLESKGGANQWGDKVDERGFVDGVKVARKMSKANVLGKATEYIRVLKKREARMKREQDGLKSLVSGLVGGPALLREWEREWKDKFGGEERDEIEGDDGDDGGDDDDGEDGGDSDGEDGEDGGRARKKAKVSRGVVVKKEKAVKPAVPSPSAATVAAPSTTTTPAAGMPEKRKRGRPRKVPLPPVVSAPITMQPMEGAVARTSEVQPQAQAQPPMQVQGGQQQQQQQYLLAAFAFFSVLNSPLAASFRGSHSHSHHAHSHGFDQNQSQHHGQVLSPLPPSYSPPTTTTTTTTTVGGGWGTNEYVQAFHLVVSVLVVLYVVVPWLGGVVRRGVGAQVKVLGKGEGEGHGFGFGFFVFGWRRQNHLALLRDALSPASRGSPSEAPRLRAALGVSTGVVGLLQGVIKAARVDRGLEMNQLEQRAWVRLGELIAFDGSVSRATRLQTYWCMSWHVSTFATSTTDLTTLALIILPVSASKARELWTRARTQDVLRPYERLALENLSVEDAADWLAKWQRFHDRERRGGRCAACEKRTPLGVLAAILTRERLRKHAAVLFVRSVSFGVSGSGSGSGEEVDEGYGGEESEGEGEEEVREGGYDPEAEEREDEERKQTIDAGKSIGGRTAELAVMLEKIWNTGFGSPSSLSSDTLASRGTTTTTTTTEPEEIGIGCVEEHDLARSDEVEIRTLLTATEIYRRIFPSPLPSFSFPSSFPSRTPTTSSSTTSRTPPHTLSTAISVILSPPPPSPSPSSSSTTTTTTMTKGKLALTSTLRAALASGAFDFDLGRVKDGRLGVALEEARDRVCDMLTEVERCVRRNVRV